MKRLFLLLLFLMVAGRVEGASIVRYVNTASSGGNGTTNGTSGANAAYASLSAWEAAEQCDLTDNGGDVMKVYCSGVSADTTGTDINGWTTSATSYIEIIGDNTSSKWNTSAYRIEVTNTNALRIYEDFVRVHNIQIKVTASSGGNGIQYRDLGATARIYIYNNVIFGVQSGSPDSLGVTGWNNNAGGVYYIFNNIIYDFVSGTVDNCAIRFTEGTTYIENNTMVNCRWGIIRYSGTGIAINNISKGCYGFMWGDLTSSDYNATDNASLNYTGDGGHSHTSHTFAFVSDTTGVNADFHLASSDTGAIDLGTSSVNGGFTTDIDGQTRSGTWDIGADEYVASVTVNPVTKIILGE